MQVPRFRWGGGSTTRDVSVSSARDVSSRSSISSKASATSAQSEAPSAPDSATYGLGGPPSPDDSDSHDITPETLITLYTSLRQGLSLRQWVLENLDLLRGIDVRRLITFGVIKGFLYRIHKYAVLTSTVTSSSLPPAPPTSLQSNPTSTAPSAHGAATAPASDSSTVRATMHRESVHLGHKPSVVGSLFAPGEARRVDDMARLESIVSGEEMGGNGGLLRFLDGMHCFDEICTAVGLGANVVEGKIRGLGDVQIFSR